MNWEALAAVAEPLGSIAILVTLIYLAVQIRQNTQSVATATYESVMSGFNDVNMPVLTDPELLSIFLRGTESPESLDEAEEVRFVLLLRCYGNHWLKLLRLHQHGVLSGVVSPVKRHKSLALLVGARFSNGTSCFWTSIGHLRSSRVLPLASFG